MLQYIILEQHGDIAILNQPLLCVSARSSQDHQDYKYCMRRSGLKFPNLHKKASLISNPFIKPDKFIILYKHWKKTAEN